MYVTFIISTARINHELPADRLGLMFVGQVSEAAESVERLAGVQGAVSDDRRLQRAHAAAGADDQRGDDAATLEAHRGSDQPVVRRRSTSVHARHRAPAVAFERQGQSRGVCFTQHTRNRFTAIIQVLAGTRS